ncbi:hypothetical protein V8E54_001669 [Elaphomyces granulatus]
MWRVSTSRPTVELGIKSQCQTPLSRAVEKDDETVAALLLKYDAQPDLEDKAGWKPLSRAVERGSMAIVQLLLAQGVKMNYNYNIGVGGLPIHTELMADTILVYYYSLTGFILD